MPDRPTGTNFLEEMNRLFERVRALETVVQKGQDIPEPLPRFVSYRWQSKNSPSVEVGHKLAADRGGVIQWCRAERSAGDGATTATLDVLHNGVSIFTDNPKPTVAASEVVGPECTPNIRGFGRGDTFYVNIEDTGDGTGPLVVTIRFVEEEIRHIT